VGRFRIFAESAMRYTHHLFRFPQKANSPYATTSVTSYSFRIVSFHPADFPRPPVKHGDTIFIFFIQII